MGAKHFSRSGNHENSLWSVLGKCKLINFFCEDVAIEAPDPLDPKSILSRVLNKESEIQATGPPRSDAGVGIGMLRGISLRSAN